MIRLYINLTNKCNTECEFCCMYSSQNKNTYLSFDKYKQIIDKYEDDFELQLEGGEPLLNKNLFLFIEYAISTGRCKKIIILSNGKILNKFIKRLVDIHEYYKIPVLLKLSVNYWLYNDDNKLLDKFRDYYLSTEFIEGFDIKLNVRLRKNDKDKWLINKLEEYKLKEISNIYYFQSYGKLTGTDYSSPVIVQNVDKWFIYSSDGECFEQDLILRSEYEKGLN